MPQSSDSLCLYHRDSSLLRELMDHVLVQADNVLLREDLSLTWFDHIFLGTICSLHSVKILAENTDLCTSRDPNIYTDYIARECVNRNIHLHAI